MNKNPLKQMETAILKRFPVAKSVIDLAEDARGSSFLDVTLGDYSLVVEWDPKQGIGITANPEMGYGEGPEEIFQETSDAQERVIELLLSKTKTIAPAATLSEIRRERGLTQTQLASSLNVRQASIAKMEKRSDILVSTLQAIIAAMGGRLNIRAVFPDGEKELIFGQPEEREETAA